MANKFEHMKDRAGFYVPEDTRDEQLSEKIFR